jgi:hypothetical protein
MELADILDLKSSVRMDVQGQSLSPLPQRQCSFALCNDSINGKKSVGLWLPKITKREENGRNSWQYAVEPQQKMRMKEVKETVAQFVKDKRNQIILGNQERLWYNGSMRGGYEMYDIDDMIYNEDYKVHSTK